ncbi:hypothetical protein B0T25DRAFT_629565 [Lasiosphaeria hispida]|uniref:Clr5 domain-containing protein n=1 Tax=Lasiosphaeria hispida TaxID=260671 RepID=A0AAJ0HSN7_9PEZI|nr:hypothetical protein B0T25DRAFT_629565 [Lasiosphaeria hispida]
MPAIQYQTANKSQSLVDRGYVDVGTTATSAASSGGRKWASDEDWEKRRLIITRLYVEENKKLWQIQDHMSKEHDFYATPKMYKTRFRRWNLWKNTKAADVAAILRQTPTLPTAPQTFTVNNKQISTDRVARYIRNRARQHHIPPSTLSTVLLHNTTPKPLALSPTSPALTLESTLRAIHTYFLTSLAARWTFPSPADCDITDGAETCRLSAQFHERFKTAAILLASPAHAASGVRMARICFAELHGVLDGGLGPEDPVFLVLFLIVLQALRRRGLRGIEVRLVGYAAELGGLLPAARPGRGVWNGLRDLVVAGAMDDEVSLQIIRVVAGLCVGELGRIHAKTLEVLVCGYCNFDGDTKTQERMYLGMLKELDELGTFDERHAGVRMNLAIFYNMFDMHNKAVPVILDVVEDPRMLEGSKRYRGVTYKLYFELGNSRKTLGELALAETAFRDAVNMAKWELSQGTANKANVLEGLVSLEEALREMGRGSEADECAVERDAMVREGLESIGEEQGP